MQNSDSTNGRPRPIASRLHLAVFLWIQMWMALSGGTVLRRILATVRDLETLHFRANCYYVAVLVTEWALLGYVCFGIRKTGTPLRSLIGGRWKSVGSVAKDVGLGIATWVVWLLGSMGYRWVSGVEHKVPLEVRAILPGTGVGLTLWLMLSLSAGFCEEVVYRGYLQRQLLAMSGNVRMSVIIQGVLFGLVHSYQGPLGACITAVFGVLLGALAAWRSSLRPGMIAHAWQDALVGVVMYLAYRAYGR